MFTLIINQYFGVAPSRSGNVKSLFNLYIVRRSEKIFLWGSDRYQTQTKTVNSIENVNRMIFNTGFSTR